MGEAWGHASYMVTRPVTLKAMLRVCADIAAEDGAAEDRVKRWQKRLAPWSELAKQFRQEGLYERFPAKGQIERVARIHRDCRAWPMSSVAASSTIPTNEMTRTLGQFVEQEGILSRCSAITQINAQATAEAKRLSKLQRLPPVQCFKCTARKACCMSVVVARFYEGVVVASHLVEAKRDSSELRAQLRAAATAMEAASPYEWRVPCVFLDAADRCTVYSARPTACGTLYVYSPSDQLQHAGRTGARVHRAGGECDRDDARGSVSRPPRAAQKGLAPACYLGVLPRMVVLALETWDREDYRDVLHDYAWPSDADIERWNRR